MPYRNKQMLRDANGDLIPQYWDVTEQTFKPLTGRDGANDVRLTGSKVDYIYVRDIELVAGTTRYFDVRLPGWCEYIAISAGLSHSVPNVIEGKSHYTWSRAGGQGPTLIFTTAELPIDYVWDDNKGWVSEKMPVKGEIIRFSVNSISSVDQKFNLTVATYGNVDFSNRATVSSV